MKGFWGWIKKHPILSVVAALIIACIAYFVLFPGGRDYEYVEQKVTRGEVTRLVSASGTLRALNTINVG
ncbi:MAG: hypothetical protein AAFQ13_03210, partial [Pseudomonadota bacterium]